MIDTAKTDILAVSGLRAGYGETVILEDIDFVLPERGSLAVLGRNGVGKTTLLATILGRTTWHSGAIKYKNHNIEKLEIYERCRRGVGYVPQTREIFTSLTVEENLTVAQAPGKWTLAQIYDLFPNLSNRRSNRGNQLSGGEQQMLAIGRALMSNPGILLMDEPFEGLAPIIIDSILKVVERLVREESLAIILVEQHAKLALRVTQDALVMSRGRIIHSGPSAALLADDALLARLVVAQ